MSTLPLHYYLEGNKRPFIVAYGYNSSTYYFDIFVMFTQLQISLWIYNKYMPMLGGNMH